MSVIVPVNNIAHMLWLHKSLFTNNFTHKNTQQFPFSACFNFINWAMFSSHLFSSPYHNRLSWKYHETTRKKCRNLSQGNIYLLKNTTGHLFWYHGNQYMETITLMQHNRWWDTYMVWNGNLIQYTMLVMCLYSITTGNCSCMGIATMGHDVLWRGCNATQEEVRHRNSTLHSMNGA